VNCILFFIFCIKSEKKRNKKFLFNKLAIESTVNEHKE